MEKKCTCRVKVYLAFSIVSIVLFIVSLVLVFKIIPDIIHIEIAKSVRLENNTDQFNRFMKLPFPLDFSVYMFQVENPDEVLQGAKPNLTQIGPFVYNESMEKFEHFYDTSDDSISYTTNLTFTFDQEASNGLDENQNITVLNPPYWITLQTGEELGMSSIISYCMKYYFASHNSMFITATVRELLFDGIIFMEPPNDILCWIAFGTVYTISASKKFVDKVPDGTLKFSYLNYKVRSNDGLYSVNRGIDDVSQLGNIMRLNNETHTKIWSTDNSTCDEVKGTDSTIYAPYIETDSTLRIYSTDICRYVTIYYKEDGTYKDIDGLRFSTTNQTLRPSTANPADDCFCSNSTKDLNGTASCFLDGILDLQPCLGVPVLLSFPHFLGAEQYTKYVDNMHPNASIHETALLVEPNTGTPLMGAKRIQFNTVVRPIDGVQQFESVSRSVLPLFWIEEGVQLPDDYIDLINDLYFSKKKLADIIQWTFMGVSAGLTVIFTSVFVRVRFF